jgi:glycosyltransferase involved in cell wall biosynthesis
MTSDYNYKENYDSGFKPYVVQHLYPTQKKRRRILHAIGNFHTGGSSRLIVDLIEHLGYKFEQEIITRDLPDKAGYTGLKINHFKRLYSPKNLLPYLRKFNPEIIHIHFLGHHENRYSEFDWKWYHNIFKAAELYGCKIVENINIPIEPYISEKVNSYIFVSDYVKEKFGRLDSRNITIYPGSDLSFFSRKKDIAVPDDCIGMVYRLQEDKLNESSIDAFIKAVQRKEKTKVLIVGGGKYLETYQDAVRKAGLEEAFTYTGYVSYDELPSLISRMSVFVAPVHTESFGQVSPFAMGMGIPVVGYDVGALEEITANRSLLAPPGDSDCLADIIVGLLNDRERRLKIGETNRKRAEQLFSVEAMSNSYNQVYNNLLNIPGEESDSEKINIYKSINV